MRLGRARSMDPAVGQSAAFGDFRRALIAAVQRMTGDSDAVGFALTPGFGPLLALGAVRWLVRDRPVRTYAVGFGAEDQFIEQAQNIAQHFCTEHRTIVVTPAEAHSALHEVVRHTEDPLTPEHALELLLIARFGAALGAAPILVNGFSLNVGAVESDVASCRRIQLVTRVPLGSLFHDVDVRARWAQLFCTEERSSSLWPRVMREASAGMLSPELLKDLMVTRPASPSRSFAHQLRELSVHLVSGTRSNGAAETSAKPVRTEVVATH